MNEMKVNQKSPEALGAEIRNLTTQARCMTVYFGVEIGRRLAAAKEMVPYGTWGNWLKKETDFSQSTATRFMKVFDEYGADQIGIFGAAADSSTLQNLSISNALRLLAVPPEEREAFAEEVDAEHISARELEKIIKERDEEKKRADIAEAKARMQRENDSMQLENAEKSIRELEEENNRMCGKIKELEARPVEVAVQRDEEAITAAAEKAAAESDEKWRAALDEANKEQKKLEKELKKAKAELEKQSNSAEEVKMLNERVDELQRKLKTSAPEIQEVKFRLAEFQTAYNDLMRSIDAVKDPETAGKLYDAVRAQLDNWKNED